MKNERENASNPDLEEIRAAMQDEFKPMFPELKNAIYRKALAMGDGPDVIGGAAAIDAAGANEPNWAFEAAKINLDRIHAVCMEFGCRPQDTVVDWLRERLTVGNPVVWAVYCGLGEMRPISVHFKKEEALKVASEIKSNTEVRPLYAAPVDKQDPPEVKCSHQEFKDELNTKLDAAESRDRQRFECAARKQGTAGGNDAADCDYPGCGCDPSVDLETEVFMRKNYGVTKS